MKKYLVAAILVSAFVSPALAEQISSGSRLIFGAMLESHLVEGRQDYVPGQPAVYGQSITDACLPWSDTLPVLRELAEAVRARRSGV